MGNDHPWIGRSRESLGPTVASFVNLRYYPGHEAGERRRAAAPVTASFPAPLLLAVSVCFPVIIPPIVLAILAARRFAGRPSLPTPLGSANIRGLR